MQRVNSYNTGARKGSQHHWHHNIIIIYRNILAYRPLSDELYPGRERREHMQEIFPELFRDRNVQISPDPRHNQRLQQTMKPTNQPVT